VNGLMFIALAIRFRRRIASLSRSHRGAQSVRLSASTRYPSDERYKLLDYAISSAD